MSHPATFRLAPIAGLALVLATCGPLLAGESSLLTPANDALKHGDDALAVRRLTAALGSPGLKPAETAKAYYLRGLAYQRTGKHAQAIADLTSALWLKGLTGEERANAEAKRRESYSQAGVRPTGGVHLATAKSAPVSPPRPSGGSSFGLSNIVNGKIFSGLPSIFGSGSKASKIKVVTPGAVKPTASGGTRTSETTPGDTPPAKTRTINPAKATPATAGTAATTTTPTPVWQAPAVVSRAKAPTARAVAPTGPASSSWATNTAPATGRTRIAKRTQATFPTPPQSPATSGNSSTSGLTSWFQGVFSGSPQTAKAKRAAATRAAEVSSWSSTSRPDVAASAKKSPARTEVASLQKRVGLAGEPAQAVVNPKPAPSAGTGIGSFFGNLVSGVFSPGTGSTGAGANPPPATRTVARRPASRATAKPAASAPVATNWSSPSVSPAATAGKTAARTSPALAASYKLQLAAVRSPDEANSTVARLMQKHGQLLGQRQPQVDKVVLGNMGAFYRVNIGPFASKRESLGFCNKLRRAGVDCFLVKS